MNFCLMITSAVLVYTAPHGNIRTRILQQIIFNISGRDHIPALLSTWKKPIMEECSSLSKEKQHLFFCHEPPYRSQLD